MTANARPPRKPMNHAWVLGGLAFPNSAVPVLPNESAGSPAPAAVPPARTTPAMNERNVDTTVGASAGPTGFDVRAGAVTSVGARQRPAAIGAATDAICPRPPSTRP